MIKITIALLTCSSVQNGQKLQSYFMIVNIIGRNTLSEEDLGYHLMGITYCSEMEFKEFRYKGCYFKYQPGHGDEGWRKHSKFGPYTLVVMNHCL